MSYRTVEIGLPFYNTIDEQLCNKPYFNTYLKNWLCPIDRLPPFQFYGYQESGGITTFDLINKDTGATTSYLTYFTTNAVVENVGDINKYYLHYGNVEVSLTQGRYYFYAANNEGEKWYSEVFTVCDSLVSNSDKLKISDTDYLLISSTDKLLIS